jgi:hypothetical protein
MIAYQGSGARSSEVRAMRKPSDGDHSETALWYEKKWKSRLRIFAAGWPGLGGDHVLERFERPRGSASRCRGVLKSGISAPNASDLLCFGIAGHKLPCLCTNISIVLVIAKIEPGGCRRRSTLGVSEWFDLHTEAPNRRLRGARGASAVVTA